MYASLTPMQLIPDSSVFISRELGFDGVPSFSIHATCLSFLVALGNAAAMVETGCYRRVLVVSSEQGSVCRDFSHPESAVLIGDGAAAAVVGPTPDGERSELLGFRLNTFPKGAGMAELRGCGTEHHPNDPATTPEDNLFRMSGPRIYRMAMERLPDAVFGLLDECGVHRDDVDLVIPHQASGPGVAAIARHGFDSDRIVDIIGEFGNCIAASIPMALGLAHAQGRIRRGDLVLVMGTGAGLSVGAALLRW